MKNIGLPKLMHCGVENFTSDIGIRMRRKVNPLLRWLVRRVTNRKIVVETFPDLDPEASYIFAASHTLDEDLVGAIAGIPRNFYVLFGSTDQIEYNPRAYAVWVNGMIYVDRKDAQSRKASVDKMVRILNSGSDVLLYPEGSWNNSENLLIKPLFSGPWLVAKKSGCKVVPFAVYAEPDGDTIYVRASDPLNLGSMEKKEALSLLRDSLATMIFGIVSDHTAPLSRGELRGDFRMDFMRQRREQYFWAGCKWSRDVWEEELTSYQEKEHPRPEKVREFIDNVKITPGNAAILAPILVRREEDKKYDFLKYMQENWKI